MATEINAGRVAMVPKGEWSASTAYVRLDVVQYNGSSYVCKQDSTGQNPSTATTYWQLLVRGVDPSNYYTKSETNTKLGSKQDALVSGQNIKTVNGQSVLGEGNLELGELFVVTMTRNNSVYTADKSVSEIYAASYTNGKPVIAVMRDINNPIFILTDCDPDADSYVFSAIESNIVTTLRWQQTDEYTYEFETMALQSHLVSGTNIKTVNNESLLGSGNVGIVGKSAYQSYVDTTTDTPVKTEAEWVASLKGADGVDLGEVAIADNLTEGGSDKVLSAEMGKVIRMQVETILSSLGDYAFPNGKPTLDWGGTSVGITTNLVDVISSNPATSVDKNGSYTTTLSGVHEGNLYVMDVVVNMGGVDITSTCYNEETGVVYIPNVTDAIDIAATQETYVQDGLVLHLDGKNRGGTTGHWISLVDYNGTPIDFTLTNCDETHDSYVAGNGTTSKGIGSVNTLDVSPTTGTIEALYDGAEWNNDTLAILHNRGSSTVNHIGLTSWHKSESPYTANDNLLTIAMGSKVNTSDKVAARFTKNAIASGGYVSCLYNSFVINDTEPVAGFYEGSTQAADSTSMLSIFYRKTSANERYFKLNLYSIRVYNRHLTDEERAQNKRVDKKRFNLI